jgi:hypothetical protein
MLLFVLYGCETWSFVLGEGHKVQMFGNEVFRTHEGSGQLEIQIAT